MKNTPITQEVKTLLDPTVATSLLCALSLLRDKSIEVIVERLNLLSDAEISSAPKLHHFRYRAPLNTNQVERTITRSHNLTSFIISTSEGDIPFYSIDIEYLCRLAEYLLVITDSKEILNAFETLKTQLISQKRNEKLEILIK